ncbi:hypothetical protein PIB30_045563 [Stylosanthes scabra]|uniref:Uncharacterized protein n=1 Tax=Stylosanthes scabra TaxID=79078 RepID=A0ABU6XDV5_9FABA|nr:hypothetical protein [Stylosanthes scabra]
MAVPVGWLGFNPHSNSSSTVSLCARFSLLCRRFGSSPPSLSPSSLRRESNEHRPISRSRRTRRQRRQKLIVFLIRVVLAATFQPVFAPLLDALVRHRRRRRCLRLDVTSRTSKDSSPTATPRARMRLQKVPARPCLISLQKFQ